ncbi:MAG: efflux RND transporter periplasmic adaptor subunit [Planctomycetia bacterium]|nr:efflux RND transporter periplasmic adaptor subunit [Planctomycetia bacterium]
MFQRLAAIVMVSGVLGMMISQPVFSQAPGAMPPPAVFTGKVIAKNPVIVRKYVGAFEAIEKVDSMARVSGFITNVAFQEGDLVKKGDLLFEIEEIRYKAAYDSSVASVAQAKATILQAKANIAQTEASIRYAQSTFRRNEELFESGAAVSKDEVENTQSTLDGLEAQLQANKAALEAATAQLASAEAAKVLAEDDLKQTKIYAMITGRAGRLAYTLGNYVTPSTPALVTVVQMDPMYVRFSMSEKDFTTFFGNVNKLKETASLKIQLANGNYYDLPGEIAFLDNSVKTSVDSIQIWAKFPNPDELLNAGGIARVHMTYEEKEPKPAVKVTAVMHDGDGAYVYVLGKGNKAEMRRVQIGMADQNYQTIRSGLKVGETVVVDGTHKVVHGMTVQPQVEDAQQETKTPAQKEAAQ